jgi:hypothetical protein
MTDIYGDLRNSIPTIVNFFLLVSHLNGRSELPLFLGPQPIMDNSATCACWDHPSSMNLSSSARPRDPQPSHSFRLLLSRQSSDYSTMVKGSPRGTAMSSSVSTTWLYEYVSPYLHICIIITLILHSPHTPVPLGCGENGCPSCMITHIVATGAF